MRIFMVVVMTLFLAGCAAPSDVTRQLRADNASLRDDLTVAGNRIAMLEKENKELKAQVLRLENISDVLAREKDVRVGETGQLRQHMRSFVREQMSALRNLSNAEDFYDYIGGEFIERGTGVPGTVTLIDTTASIPADGTLYGVRGMFTGKTVVDLYILRPLEKRWVVVWSSGHLAVPEKGPARLDFSSPVAVRSGDLVAYHFNGAVSVACDPGAGGIIPVDMRLSTGKKMEKLAAADHQGWACSLGVYGMIGD